jgi:hypothetical protein
MRLAAALLVLVAVAGCARSPQPGDAAPIVPEAPQPGVSKGVNLIPDGYTGRFEINASVLENAAHGPQLCQAMALSYPPQCGGPDVVGFKWDGLAHESANGTKWGSFKLVGTFAGNAFTLTEAPGASAQDPAGASAPAPDFSTPCQAPAGGWKLADPAKATDEALSQVNAVVAGLPDYGTLWIDGQQTGGETPMNDPQKSILNVTFTKDPAAHEAKIREVWGGLLCLSVAPRTEAELLKIQSELSGEEGMSWSTPDSRNGTVNVGVYAAHEKRQKELDAKYGPGVVLLHGVLKPID